MSGSVFEPTPMGIHRELDPVEDVYDAGEAFESVKSVIRTAWVRIQTILTPAFRKGATEFASKTYSYYDDDDVLRSELLGDYAIWKADGVPKCYERTVSFMVDKVISNEWNPSSDAINTLSAVMSFHHDNVNAPANCYQYRDDLIQVFSTFARRDQDLIKKALVLDEEDIFQWLWDIAASNVDQVLLLHGQDAENFISLLQMVLDNYPSPAPARDERVRCNARRLLVRLAQTCSILPSSIFIKDIELLDPNSYFDGGFGEVFIARYRGKAVALKRLRIPSCCSQAQQAFRMLCREVLVWKQLKHPFILPFLGIDSETFKPEGKGSTFVSRVLFRAQRHMCLVSPWMVHGTVLDYTKSVEVDNVTIDRLAFEIAQGIEYLHSLSVVHGDLRCSNILVDDECHARIADFGLAFILPTTVSFSRDVRGSLRWMAPEFHQPDDFGISGVHRTTETDVFAFAATCLELYTGKPPFHHIRNDCIVAVEYMKGERPKRPTRRALSDDTWVLIQSCWSHEPTDRPSMEDVVEIMKAL